MVSFSVKELRLVAARVNRSTRTIRRWILEGCDISDEDSVRQFSEGKSARLYRSNLRRNYQKLSRVTGDSNVSGGSGESDVETLLSGELRPIGRTGAAAALQRLEETEERASARLDLAIEQGESSFQIRQLQDFWLKCAETLRKLDLAVEMARRDAEEQVPKRLAEDLALYISEWLRIAFMQFLSSEGHTLMGIKEFGPWKKYAIERFYGILDLTVKSSLQTRSPIPTWAADKVREAWNIGMTS